MSLFILLIMFPAIFFYFLSLVTDGQKVMDDQRLQMEWLTCYTWMQKEIKQGIHFRTKDEALLFDLPTGETIRYQWKAGKIIRQVKSPAEADFRGYTLLLQHVEAFRFIPKNDGVLVAFSLQDVRKNRLNVQTYIHGRILHE